MYCALLRHLVARLNIYLTTVSSVTICIRILLYTPTLHTQMGVVLVQVKFRIRRDVMILFGK